MNRRWNNFIKVSPGVWTIRAIILICVIGIIIIKFAQYLAVPTVGAINLNLRNHPTPNAKVIKVIPHHAKVYILQKNHQTNWWKVSADGKTGWIASWLLDQDHYNAKKQSRLAEATIVLDPGHGGNDSGTLTHLGDSPQDMEKTYTLPLALQVRSLLKNRWTQVLMTRTTDTTVTLNQRATISNQSKADLFISFHYNSSPAVNDGTGYEIYQYYQTATAFANLLDTNFSNLPITDRGISFGNFFVLRNNQRPAVLIEMGFMDNTQDLKYIQNEQYRETVAEDVVKAIKQYFK